jgi:hypothetical protein
MAKSDRIKIDNLEVEGRYYQLSVLSSYKDYRPVRLYDAVQLHT